MGAAIRESDYLRLTNLPRLSRGRFFVEDFFLADFFAMWSLKVGRKKMRFF